MRKFFIVIFMIFGNLPSKIRKLVLVLSAFLMFGFSSCDNQDFSYEIIQNEVIKNSSGKEALVLTLSWQTKSGVSITSVDFTLKTCDETTISPIEHYNAYGWLPNSPACNGGILFRLLPCKLVFDLPSGCWKELKANVHYSKYD